MTDVFGEGGGQHLCLGPSGNSSTWGSCIAAGLGRGVGWLAVRGSAINAQGGRSDQIVLHLTRAELFARLRKGPRGRRGGTSPGGHRCGRGLGAAAACGPERRPSMRLVFVVGLTADLCEVQVQVSRIAALPSMSLVPAGLGKHQYQWSTRIAYLLHDDRPAVVQVSTSRFRASHASPRERPVGRLRTI
jgi:hypothetical protein